MSIAENYFAVKEQIRKAAIKSGRNENDITLVSVTKTIDIEKMKEAQIAGATIFGENKPQEIRDKFEHFENIKWHQIGHLQKNKIKYVIDRADIIESVDSIELLTEINKFAEKINKTSKILFQLKLAPEETKTGMSEELLKSALEEASKLSNIKVLGLMTIGGVDYTKDQNKQLFLKCKNIFDENKKNNCENIQMKYLSMGMSDDFCDAIEMGSNMVRIGSKIFGKRNYNL